MAMADLGDFATGLPYESTLCNGDLTDDELDVGLDWTVLVVEGLRRCTTSRGAGGFGSGSATGVGGGMGLVVTTRAQENYLRRVRRRTPVNFSGSMVICIFMLLNSADRAGARLSSARDGRSV